MVSNYVQTPVNKFNSEFVDRATQIVELFTAHIDAKCPHCLELLSKNGLEQPLSNTNTDTTNDHSETSLNVQR